ncbi:hypothetical protein ACM9HO_09560, partial [Pseudomonas sp. KHB2.9]
MAKALLGFLRHLAGAEDVSRGCTIAEREVHQKPKALRQGRALFSAAVDQPCRVSAAYSVFSSRQARVIGPT